MLNVRSATRTRRRNTPKMNKLTLVSIGLLTSLSAFAAALPPGGSVPAVVPNGAINTPLAASATTPYLLVGGGTGNLIQAVHQVNATTFDFYYQVEALTGGASPSPVLTLLLRGFGGYGVEAFQNTGAAPAAPFLNASSGIQPSFVNRNAAGTEVTTTYATPPIFAPGVSSILVLRVSGATGYTSLIPPASGFVNEAILASQFAPTPEPSFYVAVSLGLVGLFAARRRKAAVETEQVQ
jgi:hypothetical protein